MGDVEGDVADRKTALLWLVEDVDDADADRAALLLLFFKVVLALARQLIGFAAEEAGDVADA